jgi:Tfp pilus assembly protein PilX
MRPLPSHQRGVTLFVGLIMLLLMTLLATATLNLGKSNLQIVGNFQHRNEATAAAQQAIETVVSSETLTMTDPTAAASVIVPGCGGQANTVCVDVNADGVPDVTVTVKGRGTDNNPSCIKNQVMSNAQLDLSTSDGLSCAASHTTFGVAGAPTGTSLCNEALYEIVAVATDNVTQAAVTVTEGVSVRVPTDSMSTYCK